MSKCQCVLSLSQRPPFNVLVGGQHLNTMKVSDASPTARSSTTTAQPTISKRHNPDNTAGVVVESENAPLALHNKRQRTKSGSESMDALVAYQESAISAADCCSRGESTPLCERNVRTSRPEGNSEGTNSQCLEASCSCTVWDKGGDNLNNFIAGDLTRGNVSRECRCNGQINVLESSDNSLVVGEYSNHRPVVGGTGGLSPHCVATLEYVTKLPEGCSGGVSDTSVLNSANLGDPSDAIEDLEDDDNYLDSSEEEVEDEFTIVNNEDDESCGEDDQSVISSVTVGSTCSLRSVASEALNTVCINEHGVAANEDGSLLYAEAPALAPLPSLSPSLFSHVPPSINFCQYNEKTVELPLAIARLLKWRFTNITPLIVRKTISNSGFKITKKTMQWCGTWGKHMKSPCFKGVREFQKVNHFPGTFQIGRKDKLWKNFLRLQAKFGKEEFGFIPKTFVLPGDVKALKAAFDKEGVKKKWIVKPPASARGTGIQVVHKWSQVPTESSLVVQRYISRPYLINDTKFDMRIYVLVTSFHPLRIYLYQDGLVRFASVQYNNASTSLSDRYMHLTNYSVNKSSSSYTHNVDAGQCQGHKWTVKSLWGYLKAKGVDTSALWSRIADLAIKTIISGEHDIIIRTRKNVRSRYSCHELFGFDVIIDERLRPWLLEVNISPSLHSASPLDHSVKGPLIVDVLNMVSFHIPDKLSQQQQTSLLTELNLGKKVSGLCLDRRLYTRLLTLEEQQKHIKINAAPRSQYLSTAIENLTSDDVRHLLVSEDELHRAGKFSRIFPTAETFPYMGFIDKPRYYNRLLDAWENSYGSCREKGIERLEALCAEKFHLKVPHSFKMPKVTLTSSNKVASRLPHSPLLGKFVPQPQSSPQLPLKSQSQPLLRGKKKTLSRPRLRDAKIKVNPLKPASVSKFLMVRGIASGLENIEEAENENDLDLEGEEDSTSEGEPIQNIGQNCTHQYMIQEDSIEKKEENDSAEQRESNVNEKNIKISSAGKEAYEMACSDKFNKNCEMEVEFGFHGSKRCEVELTCDDSRNEKEQMEETSVKELTLTSENIDSKIKEGIGHI
ncbi:tubulin monoglutamylase TTLL4-like isoform X1 [Macrobrachium nipponense]|uniref:tubulin monoglutamylase TTLL4-like isoform X1 n=1 Tax=Macrobrachium nipponense TaxID=159736 RepID=UPI0030C8B32C